MSAPASSERLEVATARAVAERSVAPVVAGAAEGDRGRLEALVAEARRAGLLASAAEPEAADGALWGRSVEDAVSVAMLGEVARICAGSGLALHAAALGVRLAREIGDGDAAESPAAGIVVAAPIAPRCPPLEVLESPAAAGGAWVRDALAPSAVTASFPFVWAIPEKVTTVFAFLRAAHDWALVWARREDPGAYVGTDERPRLGLRACPIVRVTLDRVPIPPATVVARGERARVLLFAHLRRLWLGLAALSAGAAAAAVDEAARYANERFQGGGLLAQRPAVQSLLGDAASRAAAARATVDAACAQPDLPAIAAARLAVTADAASAVTNALQVLGGNGYMEDYPLEKRLRDVESLRVTCGTPDDLRRIVAAAATRRAS